MIETRFAGERRADADEPAPRVGAPGQAPLRGEQPCRAAAPLAAAEALSLAYEGRTVLRDASLTVRPGELVTVIGPNGGGKSSLLKAIIGVLDPSAGMVARRAALRVGYAPQAFALDRSLPLTVDRFLSLGAAAGRRMRPARDAALATVGLPSQGGAPLASLSGGERQRALLARALLREPELLALDEPTQGLDHRGAARFYEVIEELRRRRGLGVLMVSHDLPFVMAASDRVYCVNGQVLCEGAPRQVSAHPEYRRLFGAGRGADAEAGEEVDGQEGRRGC
ncbi:MAG: metal ABC transporter ATP-binding protein [Pseudomonadota bacterium]